jgi:hypothetical protein
MPANGRFPQSALASIGGGYYLAIDAARAFNAMSQEAGGIHVVAGYRTYERQVYFWNLYRSGRGNLAAYPGTSNHGWGLAVDLASYGDRQKVDIHGRKFGWSKGCSDAQSEWWHIKYNPGCTGASWHGGPVLPAGPRTIRYGMRGHDVRNMQVWLVRSGCLKKARRGQPPAIDGVYGRATHGALVLFQRQHHLVPDGVAGPKTIGLLKKLYGAPWPRRK